MCFNFGCILQTTTLKFAAVKFAFLFQIKTLILFIFAHAHTHTHTHTHYPASIQQQQQQTQVRQIRKFKSGQVSPLSQLKVATCPSCCCFNGLGMYDDC